MWLILAQTDALAGASGWAGAGLLGLVLAWLLFKHLPDKDFQLDSLIKGHNEALAFQAKQHAAELEKRDAAVALQAAKNTEAVAALIVAFKEEQKETRHDSRDALQTILNRHAAEFKELTVALKSEFEALSRRLGVSSGAGN